MQLIAVSPIFQCTKSLHSSYRSQGGLWRFENTMFHLQFTEFRFLCSAKATALLLLHRLLIKGILNSQFIFFFPVSDYLRLYCCFYRPLNPCREREPHRIPYGSTMMVCSGIILNNIGWQNNNIPCIQKVFKAAHRNNCAFFQLKLQWCD